MADAWQKQFPDPWQDAGEFDVDRYLETFDRTVVMAYEEGKGDDLPGDVGAARSLIPPGTAAFRDFSNLAPDIPVVDASRCVGCMTCVTECPDTAILARVLPEEEIQERLAQAGEDRAALAEHFAVTAKFHKQPARKGEQPALFGLFVDPSKCKGCAECVQVCQDLGYHALSMVAKGEDLLPRYRREFEFFQDLPDTPPQYLEGKALADIMLTKRSLLYVGGAGSCAGCGEGTALRMLTAANGFQVGAENVAVVAATGCNTVYSSTYPYNPFQISWTNSLFENAAADAMGIRARWDQLGWQQKRLWVVGGDGAMYDIGLQSLSRMLASGADIKVLVLDTQVYSNTGGQTSTASYQGQESKMSAFGKAQRGKIERRKELSAIAMAHGDVYVAQTTAAHINHFYRAVMGANEYPGPAVIIVYTTCQPEHGVGDALASAQAKLAVTSRAFPLFIYDPRKGERMRDRLSLLGNPNPGEDWATQPKTGEIIDFLTFARSEGRFAKQFAKDGTPSAEVLATQAERLANWRHLMDLAGILPATAPVS